MQQQLAAMHGMQNYEDLEVDEIGMGVIRARQYGILLAACIMIPILLVLVIVCEVTRRKGHACGIPVQIWVECVFIFYLVYFLLTLNELWIIRCSRNAAILYGLALVCFLILAYSALTIYGYVIYFSDDNNC